VTVPLAEACQQLGSVCYFGQGSAACEARVSRLAFGPSLQCAMTRGIVCGRGRSQDQPAALNSPRAARLPRPAAANAAATHLAATAVMRCHLCPPVHKLPCAHRRDAASLPGELDGVSAAWSAPATPNGAACGARTPGGLANGGDCLHGSAAAGESAPPRLFIDLRPFMDRAPTTVRCATRSGQASRGCRAVPAVVCDLVGCRQWCGALVQRLSQQRVR
jgi:hypothetical protein